MKGPNVAALLLIGWLFVTMIFWFLAFFESGESTPAWLITTQEICFGRTETGLPDTKGWITLILAPLSFLMAIFVSLGKEVISGVENLLKSSFGKSFFIVLSFFVLIQATWTANKIKKGISLSNATYAAVNIGELPESYPRTNTPAPEIDLIDQHGNKTSLDQFKGKTVVLSFAFSHCKTICPAIIQTTQTALKEFSQSKTAILIITLDPWRDTPSSLSKMAKKFNANKNTHILSGEIEQVNKIIKNYNMLTTRDEKTGNINHPALVYVIDASGSIAYTFNNPSPTWLSQAVRNTLDSKMGNYISG